MRLRLLFMVLLATLSSAALAASGAPGAAEGGAPAPETWTKIGFHAFNLALLLGLLYFALRGRMRDALKNRSLGIKRAIDEANAMRKEAQARYEQLERQLEGFEQELAQMRRDAEREAQAEREAILRGAEQEAALIKATAERTIRDETERARSSLRREAADLAIELARKQLARQVGPADDARLAAQFLTAVRDTEVADG